MMTGTELQSLRQRLGLKQREAAQLIGVGLRAYQHWEGDDRAVPPPVHRLVCLMAENSAVRAWLAAFNPTASEQSR